MIHGAPDQLISAISISYNWLRATNIHIILPSVSEYLFNLKKYISLQLLLGVKVLMINGAPAQLISAISISYNWPPPMSAVHPEVDQRTGKQGASLLWVNEKTWKFCQWNFFIEFSSNFCCDTFSHDQSHLNEDSYLKLNNKTK